MKFCVRLICACLMWVPALGSAADLTHARAYTVVSEIPYPAERQGRGWYIVSDADSQAEFLETAMSAALELHGKYGSEYTTVILVPNENLVFGTFYASISYSARGRGARAIGPRYDRSKWLWRGLVSARPLTPHELRVAELWYVNQNRFPQTNMLSSCGYNRDALVEFIASELGVSRVDAELAQLPLTLIELQE